jgi:hypothetical protein
MVKVLNSIQRRHQRIHGQSLSLLLMPLGPLFNQLLMKPREAKLIVFHPFKVTLK